MRVVAQRQVNYAGNNSLLSLSLLLYRSEEDNVVTAGLFAHVLSCRFILFHTCFGAWLVLWAFPRYNDTTSIKEEGETNNEIKCKKPVQRYCC